MTLWVEQTRVADAAKALANGKGITAARYGGLDVNHLIDTPYDINQIFTPPGGSHVRLPKGTVLSPAQKAEQAKTASETYYANREAAARNIAEVRSEEIANKAYQSLGATFLGPAPWEMTEADYVEEVSRVEAQVKGMTPTGEDGWGDPEYSPEDNVALARIVTLIPDGIDPEGTMSYDELYQSILQVARAAGLV